MLEDVIVIGVVMAIVELIKILLKKWMDEDLVTQVVPLIVLALAGGLNVLAGYVFAPETPWRENLLAGLVMGAIASGIYSQGKALLGKS